MSQIVHLSFAIKTDWHIGSGATAGAYADSLSLKNAQGLPYIPGKAIKGLLKDAYLTGVKNAWFGEGVDNTALLFGSEGQSIETQGLLQVTSANLSQAELDYFNPNTETTEQARKAKAKKVAQAKKQLYKVAQFTAIDHQTGVALNSSLRSMEVCIPLTLNAAMSLNYSHPHYQQEKEAELLEQLKQVAPLIHVLGAKRHRGFGQVDVCVIN